MKTLPDYRLKSDDDIALEREKVQAAYSLTSKFFNLSAPLTAVTFVGWLISLGPGSSNSNITLTSCLFVGLLFLLFLSLIATTFVLDSRVKNQKLSLVRLTPLSETDNCSTALSYVESSPGAHDIYKSAMAVGRQLYMFDFEAMEQIVEEEGKSKTEQRKIERAQKNAEACRKLHGVTVGIE